MRESHKKSQTASEAKQGIAQLTKRTRRATLRDKYRERERERERE